MPERELLAKIEFVTDTDVSFYEIGEIIMSFAKVNGMFILPEKYGYEITELNGLAKIVEKKDSMFPSDKEVNVAASKYAYGRVYLVNNTLEGGDQGKEWAFQAGVKWMREEIKSRL